MAADPSAPLDDDAVPIWVVLDGGTSPSLPAWYLPQTGPIGAQRGWRRWVGLVLIVALVAIPAAGLCITYGQLTIA
jgi:hypothetical protein